MEKTKRGNKNKGRWSPEMEGIFIDYIRERCHLWCPQHPHFKKNALKNQSYIEIGEEMVKKWPDYADLFTYALVSVAMSQTCEKVHFERCMEQLVRFAGKDNLIFGETETELREQCLSAQSALGCVTRYIKKCVALDDRKAHNDGITGLQKLTEGLCSENSDLRIRYLNSLPCFQNVSEGMHFCQEKFKRNENDISQVSYTDKTPLFCCSFDGYRRCLRMLFHLEEKCQDEPVSVIDEVIHRLAGVLGDGVCDEYFERCTGAGAGSIGSTAVFVTAMLLSVLTSSAIQRVL